MTNQNATGMTYDATGVNYALLDRGKRSAQELCRETLSNPASRGVRVVPWSLGESVSLVRSGRHYLGHVTEGLGTKNLVADALAEQLRIVQGAEASVESGYFSIGICAAATMLNDLITLGILPVSLQIRRLEGCL